MTAEAASGGSRGKAHAGRSTAADRRLPEKSRPPLILGHRGAPEAAPENTIAGFTRALEMGADGVELDVQRSLDGVPLVIHDDSLERTGHGHGRLDAMPWADLFVLRGGGEPIPSLAQAVHWAARADAWLNVEVKTADATAEIVPVLQAGGIDDRLIVSSFHPEVVAEVGRLAPSITRYLLLERWGDDGLEAVHGCGAQGVCLGLEAAGRATLHTLAEAGLPVIVWTVDDPGRIAALLEAGVAGIITNRPNVAARIRG